MTVRRARRWLPRGTRTGAPGPRGSRTPGIIALAGLLALPVLGGLAPAPGSQVGTPGGAPLTGAAPALHPDQGLYAVFGNVWSRNLSGGPANPLPDVTVEVADRPCPQPTPCTAVANATAAGANASWAFLLAPGIYFLYTLNYATWGAAEVPVTVTDANQGPIPLEVYPFVPYSNRTFVLPNWSSLAPYAANCNAALPCHSGSPAPNYGSQVPLLSWTQDGALYVNSTEELVFYSFANLSVTPIAPWLPLYTNVMAYEGVENTEWITVDGSYVYEFGCLKVCTLTSNVTFYAVNVSTHRTFEYNLTTVDVDAFSQNGQVDMIGENGNHSIVAFTDSSGVVYAYNLWNQTEWTLATLPYFEANNNYWVPNLNSYFDVEAQSQPYDWVIQLRLVGPYPGTSLDKVAVTTYADDYATGGVNGIVVNATAQQVIFTAQDGRVNTLTAALELKNGTFTGVERLAGSEHDSYGHWPNSSAYPNVEASEHRPSYVSNGPAFAGQWNGWLGNNSSFVDPVTGNWLETNLSFDHLEWNGSGKIQQHQLSPAALEGLFFNTTYSLIPWAYDCRVNFSACALNGADANRSAIGTVWWTWESGAPEFPYPATAPIAETVGPSAPRDLNVTWDGHDLNLSWAPPTNGTDPLVNYTLFLGSVPGDFNQSVSIAPQATHVSVPEPNPSLSYFFRLEAWNLHWHGPSVGATIHTAAAVGYLNLTVMPSWATVKIDGSVVSVNASGGLNVSLADGSHLLAVTAAGYQAYSGSVQISYGNVTTLTVALPAIEPVLAGSVDPADATVDVNGFALSTGPNGSFEEAVPPGTYSISASAAGYWPLGPFNLTLTNGESVYEPLVLERQVGWIAGTVRPNGSLLTLDGVPVAAPGGSFNLSVPTGPHTLWADTSGYVADTVGPFAVDVGETTWVNLSLSPEPATWVVTVTPANATIAIDSEVYSRTDAAEGISLAPGPHRLAASAPGYDPYAMEADALPNTTTVWQIDLNRSVGWADVVVTPAGATLSVDGGAIGLNASGRYNLTLPAGRHTFNAAVAGGSATSSAVVVPDHGNVTVRLTVGPAPAVPSDLPLIGLGIAGGAGAVLAATALSQRFPGRRPPPKAPPSPPPAG